MKPWYRLQGWPRYRGGPGTGTWWSIPGSVQDQVGWATRSEQPGLVKCVSCPWQGSWNRMIFKISFNSNQSMNLWSDSLALKQCLHNVVTTGEWALAMSAWSYCQTNQTQRLSNFLPFLFFLILIHLFSQWVQNRVSEKLVLSQFTSDELWCWA